MGILKEAGYRVDPAGSLKSIATDSGVETLDLLDPLRQGFGR